MPVREALEVGLHVARHGVLEPLFRRSTINDVRAQPDADVFGILKPSFASALGSPVVAGVSESDPVQGSTGDCWLIAAMSAVAHARPDLIEKAIQNDGDGNYTVTLHQPVYGRALNRAGWLGSQIQSRLMRVLPGDGSRPVPVKVDSQVPSLTAPFPAFAHGSLFGEQWPALIEKAAAKLWGGSYAALWGGDAGMALVMLTGGERQSIKTSSRSPEQVFDYVKTALDAKQPMVASTPFSGRGDPSIVDSHVYAVVGAGQEGDWKYIEVRNPWGFVPDSSGRVTQKLSIDEFKKQFVTLATVR